MLPPETERVWNFLRDQPALAGFVLIGGTALALRIHHRRSEDLDLVYPELRLPRTRLEALQRAAEQSGIDLRRDDEPAAVEDFADSTLDLHDYQQNFLANGAVKVSFFVPDASLGRLIAKDVSSKVRVATLPELFKTKCLVSALRSKTRDWLDLYLLLREHGFSLWDFQQAFREAGVEDQYAVALGRLCTGVPQKDDEGYAHLISHPPSLREITTYFVTQRDQLEIETASEALRKKQSGAAEPSAGSPNQPI